MQGAKLEPRAAELEPPPRELHEALLAEISAERPFSAIEPRLNMLMHRHESYATRTGDTFYLVRTACNVGMRLVRSGGDVPERRAAKARELARLALHFEGSNIYAWALWADALAAEGCLEAAELIEWETIRRFPELPHQRTRLALLLADQLRRPQEAEALLRETIALFPDNPAARNQLALLLAGQPKRSQEAEELLRETLKLFSGNVVAYTQLSNVIGREGARLNEAIVLLDAALKIEPTNQIAKSMKQRFERGEVSSLRRSASQAARVVTAGVAVDLPSSLSASARMRRALFQVRTATHDARETAKREVEAILDADENLAYARYVAAAAEIAEPTSDDSLPAVAYLAVAREGTAEALKGFDTKTQGLDSVVISLVGASRGDKDAATRLNAWLAEPANDLSPREQSLRVLSRRVASPLPVDFVGDMLAASLGTALAA